MPPATSAEVDLLATVWNLAAHERNDPRNCIQFPHPPLRKEFYYISNPATGLWKAAKQE